MSNIKKIGITLLVFAILLCTFITNVNASIVPNNITLLNREDLYYFNGEEAYINGYKFFIKKTTNGQIGYCANGANSRVPGGKTLTLKGEADRGLTYIVNNGYPNKSFTGDSKKDFYITQSAIWEYFDRTRGGNNWKGYNFQNAPENSMKYFVNKLATEAVKALNVVVSEKPNISIELLNNKLTFNGEYYVSDVITINANNNEGTYDIELLNAPEGSLVKTLKGEVKNKFNNNEQIKVYIPGDASFSNITLKASTNKINYKVYEYTSGESKYQDIVITNRYSENKIVIAMKDLIKEEIKGQIKISKQDITNNKELPGATLVLTDLNGKVIDTWVSTNEPHYINALPLGKYILTETIAPEGYELTKEVIEFELTKDIIEKTVIMYNTPYIEVPKTSLNASNSLFIAGILLVIIGMGAVIKNVREK